MKKIYFLLFLFSSFLGFSQVLINEISYLGTTNQAIELSGPAGTDISGYVLEFSGNNSRNVYYTFTVPSNTFIDDEGSGFGALEFNIPVDIRDNANTGVALTDGSNLIEFLSWGGSFKGKGAAKNVNSSNVGVVQTLSNNSIQRTNTGWVVGTNNSFGTLNVNQTLSVVKNEIAGFALYPNPVVSGKFTISTPGSNKKFTEIYALNGALVYQSKIQSNEVIDITNLNKGIYIVKVKEEGKIATRKLIVE